MSERLKERILEVSLEVLAKQGFKKTTMSDISNAANVSRQTVYNFFPNKSVLMDNIYLFFAKKAVQIFHEEVVHLANSDFKNKLKLFCEIYIVRGYLIAQSSLDSKDLLDNNASIAKDVKSEADEKLKSVIRDIFREFYGDFNNHGFLVQFFQKPESFWDFVFQSLLSVKYVAQDVKHLRSLHESFISFLEEGLNANKT